MRQRMVAARGVVLLGPVMRAGTEQLYKQAGWIVACLAVDPELSERLVDDGALELLVHYASKDDETYQEEAAWALANLSSASAFALPMVDAGAPQLLLRLASSTHANVRMQAVWAIANLSVNEEITQLLGELDAVRILFDILDQDKDEEQALVQTTRAVSCKEPFLPAPCVLIFCSTLADRKSLCDLGQPPRRTQSPRRYPPADQSGVISRRLRAGGGGACICQPVIRRRWGACDRAGGSNPADC